MVRALQESWQSLLEWLQEGHKSPPFCCWRHTILNQLKVVGYRISFWTCGYLECWRGVRNPKDHLVPKLGLLCFMLMGARSACFWFDCLGDSDSWMTEVLTVLCWAKWLQLEGDVERCPGSSLILLRKCSGARHVIRGCSFISECSWQDPTRYVVLLGSIKNYRGWWQAMMLLLRQY